MKLIKREKKKIRGRVEVKIWSCFPFLKKLKVLCAKIEWLEYYVMNKAHKIDYLCNFIYKFEGIPPILNFQVK